jgi:hypothetical protein
MKCTLCIVAKALSGIVAVVSFAPLVFFAAILRRGFLTRLQLLQSWVSLHWCAGMSGMRLIGKAHEGYSRNDYDAGRDAKFDAKEIPFYLFSFLCSD